MHRRTAALIMVVMLVAPGCGAASSSTTTPTAAPATTAPATSAEAVASATTSPASVAASSGSPVPSHGGDTKAAYQAIAADLNGRYVALAASHPRKTDPRAYAQGLLNLETEAASRLGQVTFDVTMRPTVNDLKKGITLTQEALQQAVAASTLKDAAAAIDAAWGQTLPLQLTSASALRAALGLPAIDASAIL